MRTELLLPAAGLLLMGAAIAQEALTNATIALKPFSIDHRVADGSVIDLSWLHDKPAGKDGYLQIRDGHFSTPDGKRFRIWGVDITDFAKGSVHFPPKSDTPFWAATLSRLGINCVRLHYFDVPAPRGILAADRDDTREFDPEQLDRLDFLVAELKKQGIYSDLNLNVGRRYKAGDGVRDYALIGEGKALTFFDPRLIELQKEYARKLLTHYNPYTKSEYRNEPAIAIIEIVNENSIVAAWDRGRLRGTKSSGPPAGWQDIPPSYERELTDLYHSWLAHQRPAQEASTPRLAPDEFSGASKERFETELRFYMELETSFYQDMRTLLKQTLGCKSLLIGTSDYTYGFSSYPLITSTSQLDIIDGHGPWENRPMVNEPLNSIPVRLSRSAVAGKPFVVTEHNHRFPNPYTSEGIPLLASYGAFQDWDGIFLYSFEFKLPDYKPFVGSRADLSHDPVKLVNLAAGALTFLRADVRAAKETVARSYSKEQVLESLRVPSSGGVYFTPGFSPSAALRHESRIASFDGPSTQPVKYEDTSPIVSDTGELAWYFSPHSGPVTAENDQQFSSLVESSRNTAQSGMVTVDTPRTQALIGFLPATGKSITNLSADVRNKFATLVLTSLDSKPVSGSSRLLLAATSRMSNSPKTDSPTLIEPVTGTIVLRNLAGAQAVEAFPLDGAGRRMGRPIAGAKSANGFSLQLGDPATTWYEITVYHRL